VRIALAAKHGNGRDDDDRHVIGRLKVNRQTPMGRVLLPYTQRHRSINFEIKRRVVFTTSGASVPQCDAPTILILPQDAAAFSIAAADNNNRDYLLFIIALHGF
jgi:hypothetical protein